MLSLSLPLLLLWSGFLPLVFVKSKFSEIVFNRWILLIRKLWLQHRIIHSSAAWCMENSTPSQRDRGLRCVTQTTGKKRSQSLTYFMGECDEDNRKNLPVSCHSEEWAAAVMVLKYNWGNGEMLRAEPLMEVSGCIRETCFLCDICQGDSRLWDVDALSYISQNLSLWSDWPTT